jgi:ABC-type lipoprotein export system ATPase subunit
MIRRKNMGFIFQSYHLVPTLNVRDNVQLVLDVRGDRSAAAVTTVRIVRIEDGRIIGEERGSERLHDFAEV